ncbi:hypothetical protein HYU09_00015 [Candidatus Woesearchaeota archaeon]|nr:hypothetical protein [Candidatus Woesearchaeota archaeon]
MKNKGIALGMGIVAVVAILAVAQNLQKFPGSKLIVAELGIEEKFSKLSNAKTNFCAKADFINYKQDGERLQGSCCSAMDFHRYQEQIEGLKKFSKIKQVPEDPYDIPVSLAKELLGYKNGIQLTAEQQAVYDNAMKMSHEGGPCCCRCWRWDAFEGLAKYLITEHDFSSEQIAEVWDLSDGCGGKGHAHESGL